MRGWNSWLGYCGGAPNETAVGAIAGHLQRQLLPFGFTMLGIDMGWDRPDNGKQDRLFPFFSRIFL